MIKIQYFFEYLLVRFVYLIVQIFPEFLTRFLANLIAYSLEYVITYRRHVINVNLRIAFPHKTEIERNEIRRKFYHHFSLFLFEFIRGPYRSKQFFEKRVHVENPELIRSCKNQTAIFVSGHFGDFNLSLQAVMELIDEQINVVLKKQRNPYFDKFTTKQRLLCRQKLIYTKGALKKCINVLKVNEKLAFLNDQHGGENGLLVPFFGVDVPSMTGLPALVDRFSCPLFEAYCIRKNDGNYIIHLRKISVKKTSSKEDFYRTLLTRYHEGLEEMICKHPEQYLWSHRRWNLNNYKK